MLCENSADEYLSGLGVTTNSDMRDIDVTSPSVQSKKKKKIIIDPNLEDIEAMLNMHNSNPGEILQASQQFETDAFGIFNSSDLKELYDTNSA